MNIMRCAGSRGLLIACCLLLTCHLSTNVVAQGFEPTPGDDVQVREGDVWSPAEFLKKEGRRYQIRYADGTEEWITADRLRPPGDDTEAGTQQAGADPSPAAPPRRFERGQKVELKDNRQWKPASIQRVSDELYLIATDDSWGEKQFFWIWVDADRLRTPGEDHEGPDIWNQFEQRVGNDSIGDSARKARQAYAQFKQKRADKQADQSADQPQQEKADPFAPPPLDHPTRSADRSAMQAFKAVAEPGFGQAQPDPGPDAPPIRTLSMRLRAGEGAFFEDPKTVAANGRFALVAVEDSSPSEGKKLYAERFDLAAGRSLSVADFDTASLPQAISPDGKAIAARSNGFHGGTNTRLDIWDWSTDKPQHVVSFMPFADTRGNRGDIQGVRFLDNDRIIVFSKGGTVSVWNARDAQGFWELAGLAWGADAWAVSPGSAQIALPMDMHVILVDSTTGRTLAALPDATFRIGELAFSPNGRYLAAAGQGRFKTWDLAEHRALPSVALPPDTPAGLSVLDDGQVIVGGRTYDAQTGALNWLYEIPKGGLVRYEPGALIVVSDGSGDQTGMLRVAPLPHPSARSARGESQRLLKRGDHVSIDLSQLSAPREQVQAIREVLAAQLIERGVELGENEPVRIVANTDTSSEQRTYRTIGGPSSDRQEQTVNVSYTTTRLAVEADGVTAWQWSMTTGGAGLFIHLEEGQSVQAAINEQSQDDGSTFLKGLLLPDIVPDPRVEAPGVTSASGPTRRGR